MSLSTLIAAAESLRSHGDSQGLLELLLCGRYRDVNVTIDLENYRPIGIHRALDYEQHRDYDSCFGLVKTLKIAAPLQLWVISRKQDQLTKEVGLSHPITKNGQTRQVRDSNRCTLKISC